MGTNTYFFRAFVVAASTASMELNLLLYLSQKTTKSLEPGPGVRRRCHAKFRYNGADDSDGKAGLLTDMDDGYMPVILNIGSSSG